MTAGSPLPYAGDLALAIEAAHAAGEILRRRFGAPQAVAYKSEDQPVTEADLEADRAIQGILARAGVGTGWLSEEEVEPGDRTRRRMWVVDPLDGTTNFVAGRPEFAVSIGLLERGTPVLGVVYNPISDELYHAVRGQGAFRGIERLSAARWTAKPPTLAASPSELGRGELAEVARGWHLLPVGSTALKIARVADGSAHVYVSGARKRIWDVCAGAAIAAEAGAEILDLGGRLLWFSTEDTEIDGLIVIGREGRAAIPGIVERARGGGSPHKERE